MTKNGNILSYRVGELEDNYKKLDEKMDTIMSNHLPHLELAVKSLETRVNTTAVINAGAIITGILISKFIL